jgi:hypothetical protein
VIVCVAPNFYNALKTRREIIMRTIKFLLAILLNIAVAGCGGGGDGYSISGMVILAGVAHQPALGVTINLAGASTATTTTVADWSYSPTGLANGSYRFTGLANGNYTVTPSLTGYAFSPTGTAVSVSGANVSNTNFTATAAATTYSISGTVSGAASSGVTITLGGDNTGTVVTGAGGIYTLSGLVAGNYTVTPSLSGFTFSPTNIAITSLAANSTANDFVATAIP